MTFFENFGFIGVLEDVDKSMQVLEYVLSGSKEAVASQSEVFEAKNRSKTHSSNKGYVSDLQRKLKIFQKMRKF